ncbi:MAG: hypothetical protein A2527_05635 [Candidatus Lambdaproteobacteria bacterium RIFOXYD2_FULL_50_16]|uniref:PD-(D/E)XK nuclease superfamily protein n=1 Tax=Candidatus Lambdaproteobacteria bacterium RIFOXYD2_FULL_50_16 TaxID=1817772 RepID=A0A1F6G996_9PROT|nr:MAG: hypothetical protein A2527_05635 [Candidatus Lambdaproteobacteria bacterium RIFOXYD2_FULL_50_16]
MSNKQDMDDAQVFLTQAQTIIKKHNALDDESGKKFNIFKILRRHRDENIGHSEFIKTLLNPKGPHGQKNVFLELFLRKLSEKLSGNLPERIIPEEFIIDDNWLVRREFPTDKKRRIDLWLEHPKYIIAIEVKIEAEDQANQLADYFDFTSKKSNGEKDFLLVYWTKYGNPASDESLARKATAPKLLDTDYVCLSHKHFTVEWIDSCVQAITNSKLSHIRETLEQYKVNLLSITGSPMTKERQQELTNLLLKGNNLATYAELTNSFEDALGNLLHDFFKSLLNYYGEKNNFTEKVRSPSNRSLSLTNSSQCINHIKKRTDPKNQGFGVFIRIGSLPNQSIDVLYHMEIATRRIRQGYCFWDGKKVDHQGSQKIPNFNAENWTSDKEEFKWYPKDPEFDKFAISPSDQNLREIRFLKRICDFSKQFQDDPGIEAIEFFAAIDRDIALIKEALFLQA